MAHEDEIPICDLTVVADMVVDPKLFYSNCDRPFVAFDDIHQLADSLTDLDNSRNSNTITLRLPAGGDKMPIYIMLNKLTHEGRITRSRSIRSV